MEYILESHLKKKLLTCSFQILATIIFLFLPLARETPGGNIWHFQLLNYILLLVVATKLKK